MTTSSGPDRKPEIRVLEGSYFLQRSDGSIRFLEWWESIAWLLFRLTPKDFN